MAKSKKTKSDSSGPGRRQSDEARLSNGHRRFLERVEKNPAVGRQFFRTLFDQATHAMAVTDLSHQIIMVNKELEALTGMSESELVGRPITALYPDDFQGDVDIEAIRQGQPIAHSFRLARRQDGEVPVRVRYFLVDGPAHDELLVETFSDLSDRFRVDQLKNEFVFVAAHELRNPVTAIKLLLDLIFDDKRLVIESVLREYLLKIQEANERLTNLVDDLLEVSRTESNRLKIRVSPQNLPEHVEQIMNDMRTAAVSKSLTMKYVLPTGRVPKVLADKMKLKEILTNLLSNAIKYNMTGGTVTVGHEVKDDMVYTSVTDTGIGIRGDDRKKLFEKFWRSEDMAVRAQAGTGLGLFIVRELTRRMGGDVSVQSRYGKGTTFIFSLPVAK